MERRYLTIKECAEYTCISEPTLYRWSREGKIPIYKIGKIIRFDKSAVDTWLMKFKKGSPNVDLLQNN